jgi:integrase
VRFDPACLPDLRLNLLRSGVTAAPQATNRTLDSVAFARLLIRDNSFDSKSPTVAVGHNPISVIELQIEGRPGDNQEHGAQPFNAEQLGRMRHAASQDLLAFLVLRHTGFRGSDVVGLRWEEIEWQSREIHRLTQKRRKRVVVPVHEELMFALETEHDKQQPRPEDRVLLNPATGKPLTRPRLYERILALGTRAGVGKAHPHRFRDTFAVDLLLKGASPYDVAKLLGDTIDTVEKHYAPFVRELRERARRIVESNDGLESCTVFAHPVTNAKRPN